jgi:uncharacterized protein YqhQ
MESLYLIVSSPAGGIVMVLFGLAGLFTLQFGIIWKAFQFKPLWTAIVWSLTILLLPLIGSTLFSVLNWRPCHRFFGTGAISIIIALTIFILRSKASSEMGIAVY